MLLLLRICIAIMVSFASHLHCSAHEDSVPTKEIHYRGGLIIFSVPKDWKEEYGADGGGTFYRDGPDTGTLRLNVISAKAPKSLTAVTSQHALHATGVVQSELLSSGYAIARGKSIETERGQSIAVYWWWLANVIPPNHVRIASFTYTVLTRFESAPQSAAEIASIEQYIRKARFSTQLGE